MARTVNVRYRQFLPGGGYDSSGSPRQGKSNTRGVVNVSAYTRGGVDLSKQDLGLGTVDNVKLSIVDPVRSPEPLNQLREVIYSDSAGQFYVVETVKDYYQFYADGTSGGSGGGSTPYVIAGQREIAGATVLTVSWDAFGDSAHDVELT